VNTTAEEERPLISDRLSSLAQGSATVDKPPELEKGLLAKLDHWLRLGKEKPGEEKQAKCGWFYCQWRKNLGLFLEGHAVQYFFIALLILDIVLITCELAFEESFSNEESEEWVLLIKHSLEYLSLAILFSFALEMVLLFIAFDFSFFLHPFYLIDSIIIGLSLFIDLYLKEAIGEFLIVFRFWRIIRVVHSIVATEEERHAETKREKRKLEKELHQCQKEIAKLKQLLKEKDQTRRSGARKHVWRTSL